MFREKPCCFLQRLMLEGVTWTTESVAANLARNIPSSHDFSMMRLELSVLAHKINMLRWGGEVVPVSSAQNKCVIICTDYCRSGFLSCKQCKYWKNRYFLTCAIATGYVTF